MLHAKQVRRIKVMIVNKDGQIMARNRQVTEYNELFIVMD